MEREQEITKLVHVLRQTSRAAQQTLWTGGSDEAATHAAEQYNRVRDRLATLDSELNGLFDPLDAGSPLPVVAMACRQLAAYYADEVASPECGIGRRGWPGAAGGFDPESFKDFWRKSADEIEELGEQLRENLGPWFAHQRRRRAEWMRRGGPFPGGHGSDPRNEPGGEA